MKNTKEIRTILAALFYLNRLGYDDKDIHNLLEYAFDRIFGANTGLLLLACIGRTKEDAMPEIEQLLREETKYHEYLQRKEDIRK